jgi:hypothetical protein
MRSSWWLGVALLTLGCGGRIDPLPSGYTSSDGSLTGAGSQGGSSAGTGGDEPATAIGGASPLPTGGSTTTPPGGSPGTAGSASGGACSLPWWGSTLEGVVGLHDCPAADSPALLAYGGTQLQTCDRLTGPFEQEVSLGQLRCRYNYDERGCGIDYQGDWWIEVPVFGYGAEDVSVPDAVPTSACSAPSGPPLQTSSADEQAALLHGVWLTCAEGERDPFPGNAMAFLPDGTYRALQTDSQGRLSRAPGCDSAGLWGFLPGTGQLNVYLGDRTYITFVSFSQTLPRHLSFGRLGPGRAEGGGRTFVRVDASK